ncbi:unnamed protein product [Arabidopsis arenosa]|uniref:F-box family protein n=1 Tax=Arabidopsis arenosa TaxID=38785 RepID=A0A8S2A0Y5_ARAAE|nr:unnamed protein product [Arabidopsis arenosa]
METTNPSNWSNLTLNILISLFKRLSYVDFHRAKMVCSYWYSGSKQTVTRKSGIPWLMLFPDDGGCLLCNPYEKVVYKTKRDCSGSRFLASCGKWLLMLDSRSRLYIIDVFSGNRIDLPPLESLLSNYSALKRDILWVDEETKERECSLRSHSSYLWSSQEDNWPCSWSCSSGYRLYILTSRRSVRVIDFSGQQGLEELTGSDTSPMFSPLGYSCYFSIAVTTAGEVLLVTTTTSESSERVFCFCIYKKAHNADPEDQIARSCLLLDLGITVPANHALGIQPNTIYFTLHNRVRFSMSFDLEICVFNLATNTLIKHFPHLANLKPKDALWFLPMT